MSIKKHYWTQVFIITTLMSCGLGLASGFVWGEQTCDEKRLVSLPKDVAYIQLEAALQQCSTQAYRGSGSICPLALPGARVIRSNSPILQPGATLLQLEPYYANTIAPYCKDEQLMSAAARDAVHDRNRKVEGVPRSRCRGSHPVHCTMDVTGIAITLPLLVLGLLIWFRKKLF